MKLILVAQLTFLFARLILVAPLTFWSVSSSHAGKHFATIVGGAWLIPGARHRQSFAGWIHVA
jgi:hypothetical protein